MRADDPIRDTLRMVAEVVGISEELALRIERKVRENWGGDRPYIAHDYESRRIARNDAIQAAWDAGERDIGRLARRFNLSTKQIRRVIF